MNTKNLTKKGPLKILKIRFASIRHILGYLEAKFFLHMFCITVDMFSYSLKKSDLVISWNIIMYPCGIKVSYMEMRTVEVCGWVILSFWFINQPIMDRFQSLRCLWKHLDETLQSIMLKSIKTKK